MEKRQATGSFGLPPEMEEAVRKSKAKASGNEEPEVEEKKTRKSKKKEKEYVDSESIPEEVEAKVAAEEEEEDEVDDESIAAEIEKELEITLDEDDLWNLHFGVLEKKNVCIIPGKVYVNFKTLTYDENEAVDRSIKSAVDEKLLDTGVYNRRARTTLSFCLTGLGKKGKVKSLGSDSEERYKKIGELNTIMIESILKRWNQFLWLIVYKGNQGDELKN